ncbi:AbrB family transcriptional regulator [Vibrio penaeicida]|uniref:AbrB family transcriptional regulator n=1 Tax=Vibrio penaeicida TaxID=104609 RepID=UPI0027371511|nr:AbrB family transcriptional regulator [Vibrio penaeicida]MDP2572074.1 AbrB family transcriptional regulator [Vibrio penaeicida]
MQYLKLLIFSLAVGIIFQQLAIPHGLLLGTLLGAAIFVRFIPNAKTSKKDGVFLQLVLGFSAGFQLVEYSLAQFLNLLPSLFVLLACLIVQVGVGYWWLRKREKWSKLDSILAAYPGAMAAVLDVIDKNNASASVIFVHLFRLVLLTVFASFFIPDGYDSLEEVPLLYSFESISTFVLLAVISMISGRWLEKWNVPAPYLLTTMFSCLIFSPVLPIENLLVPSWLMDAAIVVLGLLIGSRFGGITGSDALKYTRAGSICFVLVLAITALFTVLSVSIFDVSLTSVALAYAPGALESVVVVALANGFDVMFIILHHVIRLSVLQLAPAVYVLFKKLNS